MTTISTVIIVLGVLFKEALSYTPTCDAGLVEYLANRDAATDDMISGLSSILGSGATTSEVFSSLAASHGVANTPEGMEDFMMALDTISEGYFKACYGPDDEKPTVADAPDLLDTFLEVLEDRSDPTAIRNLYGRLSCLGNFKYTSTSASSCKRRAPCATESDIKALYDCLGPDSRKCIFHLDSECSDAVVDYPNEPPVDCLGFVVDTTGSMIEEIVEMRAFIANFIQANENNQTLCYTLVTFNDNDPTQRSEVNSEYKKLNCVCY